MTTDEFAAQRRMMVDCQLRTYDVTDRAVLAAADSVRREAFLPGVADALVYLDQPVAIPGTGRALMAPMVVARMIQFLDPKPGERTLEFGGGTGYGAALLAAMGTDATLWEPQKEAMAAARESIARSGQRVTLSESEPEQRFDAILVSGACEQTPESLFELLAPEGRLIVVEGIGRSARVRLYRKTADSVTGRPVFDAAAPVLEEFRRVPAFEF